VEPKKEDQPGKPDALPWPVGISSSKAWSAVLPPLLPVKLWNERAESKSRLLVGSESV
jgi:hypothetical protein